MQMGLVNENSCAGGVGGKEVTRALRFTKTEIDNAAKIVSERGVVVRLTRSGDILVVPATHTPPVDMTGEEDLDAELSAFEAKHGNG